jgi:excisionase family DNA binding protein
MQNLTIKETAERLGVGERMVRRLVAERRIDYLKIGKHVRITEKAIQDFEAAGAVSKVS